MRKTTGYTYMLGGHTTLNLKPHDVEKETESAWRLEHSRLIRRPQRLIGQFCGVVQRVSGLARHFLRHFEHMAVITNIVSEHVLDDDAASLASRWIYVDSVPCLVNPKKLLIV